MGLVHELHVVVIVSEVQGIVCKQLRKTVIMTNITGLGECCCIWCALKIAV